MNTPQKYRLIADYDELPSGTCIRVTRTINGYHYGSVSIRAATVSVKVPASLCAPIQIAS